jgi:hypothetical protein
VPSQHIEGAAVEKYAVHLSREVGSPKGRKTISQRSASHLGLETPHRGCNDRKAEVLTFIRTKPYMTGT